MRKNSAAIIRRFSTPQPGVFLLLALLLVLLLVLFGTWEYRANKHQLASLLREEAIHVSHMVSMGGERLMLASRELEEQLVDRLLDKARLLDMVEQERELTPSLLGQMLPDTSMIRLIIFDGEGVRTFPVGPIMPPPDPPGHRRGIRKHVQQPYDPIPANLPFEFRAVLSGERKMQVIDRPQHRFRSHEFTLAYHRASGGVFLLTVNVEGMKRNSQKAGIEGLLDRIYQRDNVAWVGLYDQTDLLESNCGDFPPLDEKPPLTARQAEFLQVTDAAGVLHTVLDVTVPINAPFMKRGYLRIGFTDERLVAGRSVFTRSLLLRSGLFLLLGLLLLYYFLVYSNYRTLAREYDRIHREVEQLEKEKQMVSRLQAMGELASGVAHEVRNPLNSIRMISQRLRLEFNQDKEEEYGRLTRALQDESDRINRIITDFLTFARPRPLQLKRNSIEECITQTASAMQPAYDAAGCQLQLNLSSVPRFQFDYDRLSQLLHNLLANALQAVEADGLVTVTLSRQAGQVKLAVADNGCGIAPEHLDNIFNLYFTTRAEGSGIGLAVSHQIVSEHGGTIQVDSEQNRGATLTITLPEQQD